MLWSILGFIFLAYCIAAIRELAMLAVILFGVFYIADHIRPVEAWIIANTQFSQEDRPNVCSASHNDHTTFIAFCQHH